MLLPEVRKILSKKRIILASGSQGRQEIFKRNLGLKVEPCRSTYEENSNREGVDFSGYVEETALQKVLEVENRLKAEGRAPDVVIGADTMVALGEDLLGKPTTDDEAYAMLSRLSGKKNTVYTGVVIKTSDGRVVKFTDTTAVYFGNLNDAQIRDYIATGEPRNMAGSYCIQGYGSALVRSIEGNYFNILGMPVYKFCEKLNELFNTRAE